MAVKTPEKLFFKIGEVAEIIGVESHVLRFWETEFPQIQPSRFGSKQRLYRKKDIAAFQEIKRLLYEERFTIEGTRKRLAQDAAQGLLFELDDELSAEDAKNAERLIDEIRGELLALKEFLTRQTR